jgi:hypothetical protein
MNQRDLYLFSPFGLEAPSEKPRWMSKVTSTGVFLLVPVNNWDLA